MEELIEKINILRPKSDQVDGKNVQYAFGYVDALNDAIKLVKEYNHLNGITYDLIKGDYVENRGSGSKHVTIGKKYLITKVIHIHSINRLDEPETMQNYCLTYAWILDDFGKKRRMVRSDSSLWKKVL